MTTSSSTSSFPSLMSSMSCRKSQEKCAKKRKTNWGWQLSSWQMFFLGGGKCPNLGVVNVRILGVVWRWSGGRRGGGRRGGGRSGGRRSGGRRSGGRRGGGRRS